MERVMKVTDKILNKEQMGFLKTRQLQDNVTAMILAVEQVRYPEQGIIMISLDQEKAYDRVSWSWLFAILKHMKFPKQFVEAIRLTYHNPAVKFLVNNHHTPKIPYNCGVLQRGPLSVILYLISIQPLLAALSTTKLQLVITFEGQNARIPSLAYADDITVMLSSDVAYKTMQETIAPYEHVSNAKFSAQKALSLTLTFTETNEQGTPTITKTEPQWYSQIKEPRHL